MQPTHARIIAPSQFSLIPWKNGLGVTRELWRYPAEENYWLRVSIADISADLPFSPFEGYDRSMLLLEGKGLDLIHDCGLIQRLNRFGSVAHFSGDWKTTSSLLDGPVRDFNWIAKRDLIHSQLQSVPRDTEWHASRPLAMPQQESPAVSLLYAHGDRASYQTHAGTWLDLDQDHLLILENEPLLGAKTGNGIAILGEAWLRNKPA